MDKTIAERTERLRLSRFSAAQAAQLDLAQPVDPVAQKRRWLAALGTARDLIAQLPPKEIGCLYLNPQAVPCTPNPQEAGFQNLIRHFGSIKGAWPKVG